MHYYPKNIGDYRRDTMNLSLLEHGVYMTLIDHYVLNEEPFPLDHLDVCWSIGARTDNEKTAVCLILSKFFIKTDKGYTHKRCDEEIAKYHSKSDKAKESIAKRWNKDTNVIRTYNEGNTNQEPRTNNHKPITKNHKPIKSKPLSDSRTGEVVLKVENDFNTFWEAYPKKVGKGKAKESWEKQKPDLDTVLKTLQWQIHSDQWVKENGAFIPNPATYINQQRWEDEKQLTRIERLANAI